MYFLKSKVSFFICNICKVPLKRTGSLSMYTCILYRTRLEATLSIKERPLRSWQGRSLANDRRGLLTYKVRNITVCTIFKTTNTFQDFNKTKGSLHNSLFLIDNIRPVYIFDMLSLIRLKHGVCIITNTSKRKQITFARIIVPVHEINYMYFFVLLYVNGNAKNVVFVVKRFAVRNA